MAFCLIANKLSELNDRLVQNPHVAAIEIPLPDEPARQVFVQHTLGHATLPHAVAAADSDMSVGAIARMSSGLNLVNLNVLLSRTRDEHRTPQLKQFQKLKKSMIERQCQGLVTFVEPKHTLDTVVGHTAAKRAVAAGRCLDQQRAVGNGSHGLLDLWAGGDGQDVPRPVLCRLDRHSLRHARQLPLQVRGRNGREPGTGLERHAQPGAGGGDH